MTNSTFSHCFVFGDTFISFSSPLDLTMATSGSRSSKACHNCRRQRRKCDQTLPKCLKCVERGQECLGYQRLLRWEQGLASRGKMRGITSERLLENNQPRSTGPSCSPDSMDDDGRRRSISKTEALSPNVLIDPLFQNLDQTSRNLLSYCKLLLITPSCL